VAAFEIVDSRIADWDITFGDTVTDNGSSGLFLLGGTRRTLDEFEPVAAEMSMSVEGDEASTGTGAACLDDPLLALQWLAGAARDLGTRSARARSSFPAPLTRWLPSPVLAPGRPPSPVSAP
jgi:2-keto-4-pentenoate hydratase